LTLISAQIFGGDHNLTRNNFNFPGRYALSRQDGSKDDQKPDATSEEEGTEEGATG
jgi:hypothetical protein